MREISVVQVCQKNVLIFVVFMARELFFIYFFYILIYIFFYIFFCRVILRDACVTRHVALRDAYIFLRDCFLSLSIISRAHAR